MTREKAIEVLENGAWWDLLIPITTIEGRKSDIELHEALDIAIAALYPVSREHRRSSFRSLRQKPATKSSATCLIPAPRC